MPRYSFASILTETSSNLSAETNIYKNTTNITVVSGSNAGSRYILPHYST